MAYGNKHAEIKCRKYQSPCGSLVLGAIGEKICLCDWDIVGRRNKIDARLSKNFNAVIVNETCGITDLAARQLDKYFEGRISGFDLPLATSGSDLRLAVWASLLNIPYGHTMSYSEIATLAGRPDAIRAVASAIGANPISIFIPCHRVISKSGALTGYAGGLEAKRFLLDLEQQSR